MLNTIAVEELKVPAVVICNEGFVPDGRSTASLRGMPGLRIASEAIPPECNVREEIEAGINAVTDNIITALTRPLTPEEASPKSETGELPRIVFKGDLAEVNRFFYKKGWGDGLPIVPPTEEAVKEMLTGTDLPPDHVVAKIIPRLGKATVEKIAINAVMAGALPTYMPVLIAAIEAVMDPRSYFSTYEVSTGSFSPFWIINGPIRNDLNVNRGTGALSPGNIANAVIGRAMGLIIKNIGGARKGIEDMGTYGNPGKYSMVIAENEEASPWAPLHVEQGFNKEDSTVTVFFAFSFITVGIYAGDVKGMLKSIIYDIPPSITGKLCLLITPNHAKMLTEEGWTKEEVKRFIAEYTRCPAYKHDYKVWLTTPKAMVPLSDMDSVALFDSPDVIRVIIAGGAGSAMCLITGARIPIPSPTAFVTKKVVLPANWEKLVAKYRI